MMKYLLILLMGIIPLFSFGQAAAWWYGGSEPVFDSLVLDVSSGDYDIEEQASNSGIYEINSSDLEINSESNTSQADSQTVVLQFLNIDIPAGATIDSAFVIFTIDSQTGTAGADVEIWAEDSATPIDLTTSADTAYYYTDMWAGVKVNKPTTATVSWDNLDVTEGTLGTAVGDPYPSPDIKTIIQELVDLGGWTQNTSDITLVFQPIAEVAYGPDDIGECEFESCNGTACPTLKVYYHYTP